MNPDHYTDFDHGITAIDTCYYKEKLDASHLLVRNGRAAFVDTGTNHSLPNLLAGLERANLEPSAVDYVLVTHVHLDHAGGAGALMAALPNAKCVIHPRGAKHLIHPDKLIAGTKAVYGEAMYQTLYGDLLPIPANDVIESQDGMTLRLGDSVLTLIDTPGHALHHYSIIDHDANSLFSGDTFGVSYRIFDTAKGAFIMPTTTPTHFDPRQLHASIDRLVSYQPEAIFLTHYSQVTQIPKLADDMHAGIDKYVEIARQCRNENNRAAAMKPRLLDWLHERLDAHGCTLPTATRDDWLKMDTELNIQGLMVWLDRQSA